MKAYIDFNTEKRKEATNEADENLFKLLIHAVYGKTVENKRKRITTNEKHFTEYVSRPHTLVINNLVKICLQFMKKKNY